MPTQGDVRATAVGNKKGFLDKIKDYLKDRKRRKQEIMDDPMKYYNKERFDEETFNEPR